MLVKVFRFLVVKYAELLWDFDLLSTNCDFMCDSLGSHPHFRLNK